MRLTFAFGLALTVAATGCSRDSSNARPPRADEVPEAIDVAQTNMTSGIAIGQLRRTFDVAAFRVTKTLISVRQYRQCVDAGGCVPPSMSTVGCKQGKDLPDRATYTDKEDLADLPLTCATPKQAKDYCAWQSATLPTAEQWMLAARGRDVSRYAWGNDAATCAQHPLVPMDPSADSTCCGVGCREGDRFGVGKRPTAVSPLGMRDVLLTRAELLSRASESEMAACAGKDGACVVTGGPPGAIDGFQRIVNDGASSDGPVAYPTYGFRCVWSDR